MIDIRAWDPEIVRRLNLRLFLDPAYHYDLDPNAGKDAVESTARRIRNLKREKIRRLLAHAPHCEESEPGFRDWWATWVPLCAGMQLWPDGNHRTAFAMAELVAERIGFEIRFDAAVMDQLRRESKAIIIARAKQIPRPMEGEFLDAAHPLRQFYRGFRHRFDLAELPRHF